jgi:N-methylhydantoinase A
VASVLDVMRIAADAAGLSLADYLGRGEVLVHGTTHAINAIVTGRTARTAFLTTAGHPDTLVFREGGRQDAFNFTVPYPAPFVPKALTFEVDERITASGAVHRAVDEAQVIALLGRLEAAKVEAVAVCFLWSIVNPEHELAVGRLIERHLPGVPFTLSHQITVDPRIGGRCRPRVDASLKPIMTAHGRPRPAAARGEDSTAASSVTSQGGVMDAIDVAAAPVHLINSGAQHGAGRRPRLQPRRRDPDAHRRRTGGTTFDVSLVRQGRIPRTRETWLGKPLSSHMTGMPSVDTKSIGAGGGSIAWVDAGGLLHVGPISAGAVPGPVAYGRGGTRPTVTDASVTSAYRRPFLGGRMRLDRDAAREAIRRDVAEPLRISIEAPPRRSSSRHRAHGAGDPRHHSHQGIGRRARPSSRAAARPGSTASRSAAASAAPVLVPGDRRGALAAGALVSTSPPITRRCLFPQQRCRRRRRQRRARRARGALPRLPGKTGADAVLVGIDWTSECATSTRRGRSRSSSAVAASKGPATWPNWWPTSTPRTRRYSRSAIPGPRSRPSAGTRRSAAASARPPRAG